MDIKELEGKTLSYIDEGDEEIRLTTQCGKIVRIFHEQDCCEYVRVEDTEGNWHDLIGKVIVEADCDEEPKGSPPPECPYSWTRTNITLKTDEHTVISRWLGESNGCYSESVSIADITTPSNT